MLQPQPKINDLQFLFLRTAVEISISRVDERTHEKGNPYLLLSAGKVLTAAGLTSSPPDPDAYASADQITHELKICNLIHRVRPTIGDITFKVSPMGVNLANSL